ncbi:hypothetical protein INS49_005925 [Diaporthe citri]|uniref:uncharacterized protein n=1 Tax=Diaporthe citri TaxID=83186 RepID=UPI001C80E05B|nr:uncharacterized protein INS49_005925 [Diaporthe citri]KAG6364325.1 hypothetical protein INS49_005925 [Diaporthe citri]
MSSGEHTQTQAIVCRAPQDGERKWSLEKVSFSPPADDEIVVGMVATGICHTDLVCGSIPDEALPLGLPTYPRVLGHEGAGIVKSTGSKITKVQEGDRVLLSFSCCKECYNCKFGAPSYCVKWGLINFSGSRDAFSSSESGTPGESVGGSFFGQSSFARLTKVKETSVVKVTTLLENDNDLKVLASFGCGIQTGAGTITELANAQPADTVAVLGLGAVGLCAIMGAKIRGCKTIIGVDRVGSRLELAKSLGATHVVNTGEIKGTLIEEIRGLTGDAGTTITVDASGAVPLIQQGVEFTANQGKMILLGIPPMDATLQITLVPYTMSGKSIFGSMEGGYVPELVKWYKAGNLPVDKIVKLYPAEDYLKAIKDMEDGVTVKPILVW